VSFCSFTAREARIMDTTEKLGRSLMNEQPAGASPRKHDEQNLLLTGSTEEVDRINEQFYGSFPYPWRPMKLDRCLDSAFECEMLCQAIGDWRHERIGPTANIWVAGCGTNQAAMTALQFPAATVVGSDFSQPSLDLCARTASNLQIENLTLRRESLNHVGYQEQFDYIISTGVIHHNSDPASTLRRIAAGLKRDGVLELMVYNRFHRIPHSAFQKALRMLSAGDVPGSPTEFRLLEPILEALPDGAMARKLKANRDVHKSAFADSFMQPVEYSYTMESLEELARSCGLEILQPCVSAIDKAQGTYMWNLAAKDSELRARYDSLTDIDRWQLMNLLAQDGSPMLWVYLQRRDSSRPRASEKEVCESFLDAAFAKTAIQKQGYILADSGDYQAFENTTAFPGLVPEALRTLVAVADSGTPMRELLEILGLPNTWPDANEIRIHLTTPAFPFLRAA
jgi:SAM-dependent methyltransferase